MTLPRVLFITNEAPHSGGAGSIVFQRLFRDYPADRLLVVTNRPPPREATRLECRYAAVPLAADRLSQTRFWRWRTAARVLGASAFVSLARVDRILAGFVPDLVVTLMQDSWYYDLAARYARRRQIPLALFVHDLPHGFEPVARCLEGWQRSRDAAVYRQAAVRLCISPGMAGWFLAEYGVRGQVLPPPRDDATPHQPPEACASLKTSGRLTLGYAGGLHYGYGEQLREMLPVLRRTGSVVELFGPLPGGNLAALRDATDVLRFNGYAATPADAWRGLLARCDVVLQPYLNPPAAHERQYRTHFPSKLGDCLSLGLPLLVTGPADASGMSWCLAHPGSALAVTDPAPEALGAALLRLRDNPSLRTSLAACARSHAHEFDAPELRQRLVRVLAETAAAPAHP